MTTMEVRMRMRMRMRMTKLMMKLMMHHSMVPMKVELMVQMMMKHDWQRMVFVCRRLCRLPSVFGLAGTRGHVNVRWKKKKKRAREKTLRNAMNG